ncbi:signal peptidase II [Phycisphaera mikurensis]|uniref:Lipoprotein signal peptidase n=1 Tax=Phycisphaera mikurensis (strain NBRC 102666 / KCTC 22515 / FYK2301M01) TaxID=1142394 RepID=I0IHD3_PHYMF|nr:signal peptidase II [Phycisphaera mikurensis]MBB6440920.1 signal peptidase II [Phycisphaera mikurensis]BAM04671.1 lipoprotein signal peptidase [Phycisphaera mikurensis NBRC 102666]
MPPAPPARDIKRRRAWIRFLAAVAVLLAADLTSKTLAFEHVGDRPIDLVATEAEAEAARVERYASRGDAAFDRFVIAGPDPTGVLRTQPARRVIPGLLDFRLTTNTGAVFGIGSGGRFLFVAVSVLAMVVIGWLFVASPPTAWVHHAGLALVLGGALGNLYDRVRFQAVRDLLHMLPGVELPLGLAWPGMGGTGAAREVWPWIFNLADVWLLAGVAILLCHSLFFGGPEANRPAADA